MLYLQKAVWIQKSGQQEQKKSFISRAPKSFSNPIDQANYNLGLVGTIFFVVTNKPLYNSREYFLYGNDRNDKNVTDMRRN